MIPQINYTSLKKNSNDYDSIPPIWKQNNIKNNNNKKVPLVFSPCLGIKKKAQIFKDTREDKW